MGGVDAQVLNGIYQTLNKEFSNHPELEGFLTTVKGGYRKKSADVAYVKATVKHKFGNTKDTAKFSYIAELNINKAKLNNISKSNKMVEKECNQKWWTYKSDYTGMIKHELAHALENRVMYAQATNNDKLRLLNYNEREKIIKEFRVHSFAQDVLLDTFEKINIFEPTVGDIEKYVSGYAKENTAEAFAEAYSDGSGSEFSKLFNKILIKKLKGLYK